MDKDKTTEAMSVPVGLRPDAFPDGVIADMEQAAAAGIGQRTRPLRSVLSNKHFFVYILLVSLFAHYALNAESRLARLNDLLQIANRESAIQYDQMAELSANLQQANNRNENQKTQGFIAGALDATQRKDHYTAIWHDGYNRGVSTEQEAHKVIFASTEESKQKQK